MKHVVLDIPTFCSQKVTYFDKNHTKYVKIKQFGITFIKLKLFENKKLEYLVLQANGKVHLRIAFNFLVQFGLYFYLMIMTIKTLFI